MEDLFITNNISSITGSAPCNHSSIRTPPYSPQATAAFAIAITFMMILTIVGNILVIIAVLTSRSLRGPQNLFLVSLAAADILVATLIIPFSLANELQGYWAFRSVWCEIYLALDVLFCTSSIVHLCAISLDRYLSISRPVSYGAKRTPLRIKAAIVVVWLIAAVISFPPLLSLDKSERGVEVCELNSERWYILYSTVGSFFAPCVIMILVYVRIYQIAKRHTRCPPGEKRAQATAAMPAASHAKQRTQQGEEAAPHQTDILENNMPGLDPSPSAVHIPPSLETQPPTSSAVVHITSSSREHVNLDPVESKEQSDLEREAQTNGPNNDSSSSGSEAELEKACQGDATSRELAEANTLELSGSKGFKVHVLSLARRYKNTLATATGTKLVSEGAPGPQIAATSRRKAALKREKRFTFVLAVVMGVFVVCWFPFFFSYILKAVCPITCSIPNPLFKFFFWIGYCNSCLNPVIYTIFNKDFRKAFKKILCKGTKGTFF